MPKISLFLALLCLMGPEVAVATVHPPRLMVIGEQRTIEVKGEISKFSAGSGTIRVTRPWGAQAPGLFLIKAVAEGSGDLLVFRQREAVETFVFEVRKRPTRIIETQEPGLLEALGALQTTSVTFFGRSVHLQGTVDSEAELRTLDQLSRTFPGAIHDDTQLSPELQENLLERTRHWIQSPTLTVGVVEGRVTVTGRLEDPRKTAEFTRSLLRLAPGTRLSLTDLKDAQPSVLFHIILVELKKDEFSSFGIAWPGSAEANFSLNRGALQNAQDLAVTLHAAKGRGSARILAEPELVVRATSSAELFAGGELPIRVREHSQHRVEWKPYGLTLQLKVPESSGDRFRLELGVEVSQLSTSLSQDGIPGISNNRLKTVVDAQFGVPLFLCGLLQQNIRKQIRGVPLLMDIPILGALFSSTDFHEERTELVTILMPHQDLPQATPRATRALGEPAWPKGLLPPRRRWTLPEELSQERRHPDFPWSVL